MTAYFLHTIIDTITAEIMRYAIAPAGTLIDLDISEYVSNRRPLAEYFDGTPVTVVARRQPPDRRIRIKVEGWGEEKEGESVDWVDGNELAAAFFAERE